MILLNLLLNQRFMVTKFKSLLWCKLRSVSQLSKKQRECLGHAPKYPPILCRTVSYPTAPKHNILEGRGDKISACSAM